MRTFEILFLLTVGETQRKGGMMVYDNRKIMRNYLRGWFGLDVFTVIPFDLIFTGVASAARVTVDANMFRLLRMLRLLKLARILRASRIISRWQDHIAVSFALMSLVKFSFLIMVLAHWLACAWGFVGAKWSELPEAARASAGMGPAARSNDSDGGSPKADLGTWTGYHTEMTWRQKAGVPDTVNEYELYGISLYVALNNIFGGSCEIHPGNYPEFYVQAVMLLTGSSVWAYVIGSACGIIATLDPSRIEFRQTLDELNYFCREQCLPEELAVKLRSYFRNTMHLIRSRRYDALLQKMSVRLRGDAAFRMCEFRLRSVPFLVHPDLEPEFMCNLAIKYNTNVYSRLERVPCSDLFVVERGVVAKHGKLGVAGTCFGKDVILANEALRDIGDAIALTFVQTISLTQRDIFDLLPDYPMAYVIVRKAALRMALIRALVKAARLITRSHSGLANSSMMHIFDSAMREAHDEKQARIDDERQKREAQIPLTLKGTASLEGLKATMQQARRKRAQQEAAKAGGTKKKGWGKLSLHVATGELSKDVPPAKIKSPIVEAEIDRDWALKLNSKASPELSGSFKGGAGSGAGSSACDPNLMQSVQELKAQMDQAHNDSMEVQNATLQRIALLEAALTQTLKQVAVKLEEAAKRPQSFVVRQKRGMIVKNREALAAGEQAQTTPSLSREGTSSDIAPAASLVAGAQVHASPAEVRVAQPPQPPSYQGRRSPELQEALSMESTGNSLSRSHPSDENGVLDA